MVRPLRVEYPNALYHVISRGNAGQVIYLNNEDRNRFLYWLGEIVKTYNVIIHAYCLMDNHYHLLIETPDGNLSKVMRDLNGNYSQSFNFIHKRVGHLMQGRYRAYVIEKEAYLLEVARYVVLNPVRAGLVENPGQWRWSSYKMTTGDKQPACWLFVDWILKFFSEERKAAQDQYKAFIRAGINTDDPHKEAVNGFLLGGPQFVHWVWEQTNGSEELRDHPRVERVVARPTLKEIFEDIKTKQERDDAIKFARFRCGYLTSEIARVISLDRSVVGKISRNTYNVSED